MIITRNSHNNFIVFIVSRYFILWNDCLHIHFKNTNFCQTYWCIMWLFTKNHLSLLKF